MTAQDLDPDIQKAIAEGRATYEAFETQLRAADAKTQEELDKTLITLSTFLIGAVLTLRGQFVGQNPIFGFPAVLWVAVFLPLLCVLSTLASHFLSLNVHQGIYEAIKGWDGTEESNTKIRTAHSRRDLVRYNNRASAILFALALVAAIIFAARGAHT